MQPDKLAEDPTPTMCKRCTGTCRDRRHRAKPPATRGRRGRSTIAEIPGLSDWMETQFKQFPRPAFEEIEARLRKTEFWPKILRAGRRTGKTSVHTWWLRWTADIARKRVAAEFAAAFNEGNGKDVLEIETAITGIANEALLEDIRQEVQENKCVTERAAKLIDLHTKLQASSARREAERRASGRAERLALETYNKEVIEFLKNEPVAQKVVLDAVSRIDAERKRKRGDEPDSNSPAEQES